MVREGGRRWKEEGRDGKNKEIRGKGGAKDGRRRGGRKKEEGGKEG